MCFLIGPGESEAVNRCQVKCQLVLSEEVSSLGESAAALKFVFLGAKKHNECCVKLCHGAKSYPKTPHERWMRKRRVADLCPGTEQMNWELKAA